MVQKHGMTREQAMRAIKSIGSKCSEARIEILMHMYSVCTHPTAKEVYSSLLPSMPALSKTTVYNTLKAYALAGLVRELRIEGSEMRYDGCTQEHGHFMCETCGRVTDFEFDTDALREGIPDGAAVRVREVNCLGVCAECAARG